MYKISRTQIADNAAFQRAIFFSQPNGARTIMVGVSGVGTVRVSRHADMTLDLAVAGVAVVDGTGLASLTLAQFDTLLGYTGEPDTVDERLDALEAEVFP